MASDSSMCHKASIVAYTSDWGSVFQDGGLGNRKYIIQGSDVRRLVPSKIQWKRRLIDVPHTVQWVVSS
jgi:hypothetical protein